MFGIMVNQEVAKLHAMIQEEVTKAEGNSPLIPEGFVVAKMDNNSWLAPMNIQVINIHHDHVRKLKNEDHHIEATTHLILHTHERS